MTEPQSQQHKIKFSSYAWLFLFLPSLFYYLHTTSITIFSHRYDTASATLYIPPSTTTTTTTTTPNTIDNLNQQQQSLDRIIATIKSNPLSSTTTTSSPPPHLTLKYPIEILSTTFHHLKGLTWHHDEDLGRGYLLLSDTNDNRIWRWEVGGGPIPIGLSLHMERSGCRSKQSCYSSSDGDAAYNGSSALKSLNQMIYISELGEERLVRVEKTDGARTPLVADVRIWDFAVVPPFGDVILALTNGTIARSREVLKRVPPIGAKESRRAHEREWEGRGRLPRVEVIYEGMESVEGVVVWDDWDYVLMSGKMKDGRVGVVKLYLGDEEEEEGVIEKGEADDDDSSDDEEDETSQNDDPSEQAIDKDDDDDNHFDSDQSNRDTNNKDNTSPPPTNPNASLFFDISSLLPSPPSQHSIGGLALDDNSNIYIAVPHHGIVILSKDQRHLATILLEDEEQQQNNLTDVSFGQDGYLYVTATTMLMRLKVPSKGMKEQDDMFKMAAR